MTPVFTTYFRIELPDIYGLATADWQATLAVPTAGRERWPWGYLDSWR
jgi:hypothetical protein